MTKPLNPTPTRDQSPLGHFVKTFEALESPSSQRGDCRLRRIREWQLGEIQVGLNQLDEGAKVVSHEKVSKWLQTWAKRVSPKRLDEDEDRVVAPGDPHWPLSGRISKRTPNITLLLLRNGFWMLSIYCRLSRRWGVRAHCWNARTCLSWIRAT